MTHGGLTLLLVIFLVHLVAFVTLWIRRRERYHLAVVFTFVLLVGATAARLFIPQVEVAGVSVPDALRMASWPAAAFSVGWTLLRLRRRLRRLSLGRGADPPASG